MTMFKFDKGDILTNQNTINPQVKYYIQGGKLYLNRETMETGQIHSIATNLRHIDEGEISLYEYNIDRDDTSDANMIRPFVIKGSDNYYLKGTDWSSVGVGEKLYGSYPIKGSIGIQEYVLSGDAQGANDWNVDRREVKALMNTINYYRTMSNTFTYAFDDYALCLHSIPTILTGSGIKKGSVELNFYYEGDLIGTLTDSKMNGELIQSNGEVATNDGEVGGFVLYNEGFFVLTGDWKISNDSDKFRGMVVDDLDAPGAYDAANYNPQWRYFGNLGNSWGGAASTVPKASYQVNFKGTEKIQTKTMFIKIKKGDINYSNNPTFLTYDGFRSYRGESGYVETANGLTIKNTVKSEYDDDEADFKSQVWISKAILYDEDRREIGVVSLATPLKVHSGREILIKAKLDL